MPTRLDTNFARPQNKDEFERLICDLCRLEWGDPNTDLRGRSGQKQLGVDVYGQPEGMSGLYRGVQCKLRSQNSSLSKNEIENEVSDAKNFPHKLDRLIIATDAPRDTKTQDIVNAINEREQRASGFKVGIWFWEAITQRIASYPSVIIRYYSDYFSTLTSLPLIEKLVDMPLQLLSVQLPAKAQQAALEEALQFRGIRVYKPDDIKTGWMEDGLLDGILFRYDLQGPDEILHFSGQVAAYANRNFLVLVVIPAELRDHFYSTMTSLGVDLGVIITLTSDRSINSLASDIFERIFRFGYQRRGSMSTIDVAVRCTTTRQSSALLDINWESRLSTSLFPTTVDWENHLYPALDDIFRQVAEQGDKTRIQIRPILPLPAALAWGYKFNIRVCRLGVWARDVGVSDFKQQFWLSDGEPDNVSIPLNWVTPPGLKPKRVIIELTTGPDIHNHVQEFVDHNLTDYDSWLQIGTGWFDNRTRNIDEGFAIAYSNEIGRIFRELNQRGITDFYIFLRMPSALAVIIGQRLQACGRLHLFWFTNPSYQYAFSL